MREYKSELHLQSVIWHWFYNEYPEYRIPPVNKKPRSLLVHNLLNARSVIEGAKLQSCGLTKGFPDLTLHVPSNGYHGLHMELKIGKEKPREEQLQVMVALEEMGYFVCWCNNEEDAKEIFKEYLNK